MTRGGYELRPATVLFTVEANADGVIGVGVLPTPRPAPPLPTTRADLRPGQGIPGIATRRGLARHSAPNLDDSSWVAMCDWKRDSVSRQ
jgi:hypothetical protein